MPSVVDCAGHWMPVLFHVRAVGLVWPKGFVLELELSCHKSSVSASFGLNSSFIQKLLLQRYFSLGTVTF